MAVRAGRDSVGRVSGNSWRSDAALEGNAWESVRWPNGARQDFLVQMWGPERSTTQPTWVRVSAIVHSSGQQAP